MSSPALRLTVPRARVRLRLTARFLAGALAGAAGMVPAQALAQAVPSGPAPRAEATADQRAAAQALFDDARRLMALKRHAEACPKLEESQHLDPGVGTLLNLAECQTQIGRTASAWANFLEAAYQAKLAGQTKRENTARARAAALEPSLSKLTILAVLPPGSQIEIKRDGAVVSPSLVGTAVPIDPGQHVVTATAPGKVAWETTLTVRTDGQPVSVSVPQLEDAKAAPKPEIKPEAPPEPRPAPPEVKAPPASAPPPPAPEPPPQVSAGSGPRAGGVALTILGIGGLSAAAVMTVLAENQLTSSNDKGCKGNVCPTADSFNARTTARLYGNVATGTWIGGGALSAGGVALLAVASVMKRRAGPAPVVAIDPGHGAFVGSSWRF